MRREVLITREAAKAVSIGRMTLHRWIRAGKVRVPRLVIRAGRAVRLWTRADIERLRQVKEKLYRKGRGRKPKQKAVR